MPRHVPASIHELSKCALLAELPGEQLTKLAGQTKRQEVAPGSPVILQGEEGADFYVILSGLFAVSNVGGLGPRRVLRPGDYFGEVALAMDIPRTASVIALTPSVLAACDKSTFDQFVRPLFADDNEPPSGH